MRKSLFLFLPIILLSSCTGTDEKINQGELSYEISYPYLDLGPLMSAMLPDEMTITFKDKQMLTTLQKGKMFTSTVLTNEETETVRMTLSLFGSEHYYCELTPEEVNQLVESQPLYEVKSTTTKDSVGGCWSQEYKVSSNNDTMPPFNAWFTEDLSIEHGAWFSAYTVAKGMPIIYDVERYGMMMHSECINFKDKEVDDKVFELEEGFDKINFKTYEKKVQELFDALLYE
ncbi:MAG: hypothetical protein ACI857_002302 [Arenicella sp.]|jgi:hypothetical protein